MVISSVILLSLCFLLSLDFCYFVIIIFVCLFVIFLLRFCFILFHFVNVCVSVCDVCDCV